MISKVLASVEEKLGEMFDDVEVDAILYPDKSGHIETTFMSADDDSSVGVQGGELFTLIWEPEEEEGGAPTRAVIVDENWDVERDDWEEELDEKRDAMERLVGAAFGKIRT